MIYADHAATTPVLPEVFERMKPFLIGLSANPSAMYQPARAAKKEIESSREQAALLIGASPEEIYFTSGGTESDNWALSSAMKLSKTRHELVTSAFEHHAVLSAAESLEKDGYRVRILTPSKDGFIEPCALENEVSAHTALVSVLFANNEIGTIQPIRELSAIAHSNGALFHTDAVAAAGQIPIDVSSEGIDLLSVSGHKFGAPKGIGFLYIKKGIAFPPLIFGGFQEHSRRAGTENTAAIAGLGEACRIARGQMAENAKKTRRLRDRLLHKLLACPKTTLNGALENRLPGNLNLSFEGIEGESLVLLMDVRGICLSTGSACTSGFTQESHVLRAIGCESTLAKGAIRITLGPENTEEEIDTLARELLSAVSALRALTPGYENL